MTRGKPVTKKQFQTTGSEDVLFSFAGSTRVTSKDYKVYREMRSDPTIAMARAAATAPIKFASWSVEGDDPQIKESLTAYLETIWFDLIRQLLYALDYLWMPVEKVWYLDPRTQQMFCDFKPLKHELTKVLVDKDTGEVLGVRNDRKDLDLRHSMVFTYDGEYGDPYGRSRFENIRRTAYEPWRTVTRQLEKYHQKVSGTLPVIHYPVGVTTTAGGEKVDNAVIASRLINGLSSLRGAAIPQKYEKWAEAMLRRGANPKDLLSWQISFLDVPSGAGGDMIGSAQYYDTLKVRGMLLPERAVLEGQHGTKAEAGAHGDIALKVAEETYHDIISCVQKNVVDDWVRVNFGEDQIGAVKVKPSPLADDDREFARNILASVLQDPNNADLMMTVLDFDAMLDSFNLPRKENAGGIVLPPVEPTPTPIPDESGET